MRFTELRLAGAFVLELERREDERGYFARAFCQHEFAEHGLNTVIAQMSVAFNHHRGTIRGLHFQFPPAAESKLVRCTRGAIHDVIVDLRPESPTYLEHVSVELTAEEGNGLYVPERFAHGYQVLADETEASYFMNEFYAPGQEGGIRHDDPRLGIEWPLAVGEISEKDASWRLIDAVEPELRTRLAAPAAG